MTLSKHMCVASFLSLLFLMRFAGAAECNYYASLEGPIVADYCGANNLLDTNTKFKYSCAGTYDKILSETVYPDGCTRTGNAVDGDRYGVCYLDDNCALFTVRYEYWTDDCCGCTQGLNPYYYENGYLGARETFTVTSGGANRCAASGSGSIAYSDINRNGFTATTYSGPDCTGSIKKVQSTSNNECIPWGNGDSRLTEIYLKTNAPNGPIICESEGKECNHAREGFGCTSCRPFYDRVLVDGYYECIRNDDASQDEIDYACGGGCTNDNCLQEENPNCEIKTEWGCKKCEKGYFRRDNDHLCVPCTLIPHCQSCGTDQYEWDGCDYCEKGYKITWDFLFGYNRCSMQ